MSQFSTRPRMDGLVALLERYVALCSKVPHSLLALLGRFALAALFWKAGQTKVANFALDPFAGTWQIGWPRLADFAVELFASEYQLPFIAPAVAALLAATAEHVLALLLLLGLGLWLVMHGQSYKQVLLAVPWSFLPSCTALMPSSGVWWSWVVRSSSCSSCLGLTTVLSNQFVTVPTGTSMCTPCSSLTS